MFEIIPDRKEVKPMHKRGSTMENFKLIDSDLSKTPTA